MEHKSLALFSVQGLLLSVEPQAGAERRLGLHKGRRNPPAGLASTAKEKPLHPLFINRSAYLPA
jgi:hypothetical protein